MNVKLYVSLLRVHSEQLNNLSTERSEKLDALEQHCTQENNPSEVNAARALEGVAELNSSLFAATDLFHRRLHGVLTITTRKTRTPSKVVQWCGARALFRHFATLAVTNIVKFFGKTEGPRE